MSLRSNVEYGMGRIETEFFRRGVLPMEAHEALRESKTPLSESPHTWTLASRILKNEESRDVSKAEEAAGVALPEVRPGDLGHDWPGGVAQRIASTPLARRCRSGAHGPSVLPHDPASPSSRLAHPADVRLSSRLSQHRR